MCMCVNIYWQIARERERVVDSLPIQHKVQWLYIPMKICIIARRLQSSEHENRFPFARILRLDIRRFYLEYIRHSCVSPIELRFSAWPASYRCRLDTSWFLFICCFEWQLSCPFSFDILIRFCLDNETKKLCTV